LQEKAKRVLRSLSSPHDNKYFLQDGFPDQDSIMQDTAAALEVFEAMERELSALKEAGQVKS